MSESDFDSIYNTIVGEEVIMEAAGFLNGMRFSSDEGTLLEGEFVLVCVDPVPREHDRFDVVISCLPLIRRDVDWEGLPVSIRKENGSQDILLGFLNGRGQTWFSGLRCGVYELSSSTLFGVVQIPVAGARGAVRAMRGPGDDILESIVEKFLDGKLYATRVRLRSGDTVVCFETDHESYADKNVRFSFVDYSGNVLCGGEVKLTRIGESDVPPEHTSKKVVHWRGYWRGQTGFDEPCKLVFQIL